MHTTRRGQTNALLFFEYSYYSISSCRNLLEIAIKNQANRLMEYEERSKKDLLYLQIKDFNLDMKQIQEI